MMERMVDREPAIVHRFYDDLVKHHLPAIKILMNMPSVSRHGQDGENDTFASHKIFMTKS